MGEFYHKRITKGFSFKVDYNIKYRLEATYLKSSKDIEDAKHQRIDYSNLVNEESVKKVKEMIRKYRL